jgi:hypothetical protein
LTRQTINFIKAMLDGMTGAGLFRRVSYPGAPQYAVDPRSCREIFDFTPGFLDMGTRAPIRAEYSAHYEQGATRHQETRKDDVGKATYR